MYSKCILRNAIINLDIVPKVVYQDNGRAFRAKYFTDDKGFSELGFKGLYSKLGIETVFARPYNARAKVIERFFKEFQEGFGNNTRFFSEMISQKSAFCTRQTTARNSRLVCREKLLPSYVGSSIFEKPAYLKGMKNFMRIYTTILFQQLKKQ